MNLDEISVIYRIQRGLNLNEHHQPNVARKKKVRPALLDYSTSSNASGIHPFGCPTRVGLIRGQVSVP